MNIYPVLIFLHVAGAMGIFVALGIEAVAFGHLRRAETLSDARTWMGLHRLPSRLGPISMLTTLVTGIWMMAQVWGPRPWIQVALVAVAAMGAAGGLATGRRMRRLGQALSAETGPGLSSAFRSLRSSGALTMSLSLRLALSTAILALMTIKPEIAGSLVILGVAVAAGLAAGVRFTSRRVEAAEPNGSRGLHTPRDERAAV